MRVSLRLLEAHRDELARLVHAQHGIEGAAYLLCGSACVGHSPWGGDAELTYLSHAVVPVPQPELISTSATHVTWSTESFVRLLRRSKGDNLLPAIVHSHPDGPAAFSLQDDANEKELLRLAQNRNGAQAQLISIIITGKGELVARLWKGSGGPTPIEDLTVVGRRLSVRRAHADTSSDEILSRQALVFGAEVNQILRGLKIAVVGLSGTGSPTAIMLARLGVGHLALIEKDTIDLSNLNRVHGSRRADADAALPKARALAREIELMGLGTRLAVFENWVGEPECRDALRASDVILGCTDDHDGRLLLNRIAYFYATPVIDMGLAIDPKPGGGMRDMSGRISVVLPGAPCLICRGIVDPVQAREDDLQRRNPEEFAQRQREGYVRGVAVPAPAVITFTTETACMAINELLQGLTGFRGPEGWVWQRRRRFDTCEDRRPGDLANPECPLCSRSDTWGRGDVEPFLDRVG